MIPETTFGGDFPTPTDYLDPLIRDNLAKPGNFALFPPNRYHHSTINYFATEPNPAAPDLVVFQGLNPEGALLHISGFNFGGGTPAVTLVFSWTFHSSCAYRPRRCSSLSRITPLPETVLSR